MIILHVIFFSYLKLYRNYSNLLDDTAKQDVLAFLSEKHPPEGLVKVTKHLQINPTVFSVFTLLVHQCPFTLSESPEN